MKLRSSEWFDGRDELGFQHRAAIRSVGIQIQQQSQKPVIGIANSWSELNNCNITLRDLAGHVRRGVEEAGGIALEFPTISLGEEFMKPTAMLYRNLMAMDVEETLRSNPLDGVVLLSNCDKTGPAQLMGAASANLPAIQLNAGPRRAYAWKEQEIGSGTDLWKYWDEYRKGSISGEDWKELETCMARSVGACNVMGTASTMAAIAEALGMMLPGTSTITADEKDREEAAFATGRAAVQLVELDLRPRDILTEAAFRNAIRVCMAVGGSTNAIIHLVAIAGRCGISLPLDLFDEIGRSTPCVANLKPSGKYLVHHFHAAGGVPAILQRLGTLIDGSARA
jgi:dihydroxy-acid dehydratase